MRCKKLSVIAVVIMILTIFLVSNIEPVYSAEPIGDGNYTGEDLYNYHTKFTSFVDSWGKVNTMTYLSDSETGKFYLVIKKNNVVYDQFEIDYSGMNTGYFYVINLNGGTVNGIPSVIVSYHYYKGQGGSYWMDGGSWSNMPKTSEVAVGLPENLQNTPGVNFDGNLVIYEPEYDGYKVSTNVLNIKYGYGVECEIPKPGKAVITGVEEVTATHTGTNSRYDTETNMQYNYFKAKVYLEPGINTITVTLDYKGNVYQDIRTVEYVTGVVDEDDDGIDDRTGLPVSGDIVEIGDAPEMPGDGATIIDWVEWLFQSIAWLMTSMINAIKTIGTSLGDLSAAITKIFAFMPSGLLPLMIFGMTIAIILRILKR